MGFFFYLFVRLIWFIWNAEKLKDPVVDASQCSALSRMLKHKKNIGYIFILS